MNALDMLTAHFERMRMQKVEIKSARDADGNPLVVYFDAVTNAKAQEVIARAGANASRTRLVLYTVIYLAKNADGSRMFEDNAATVQALSEGVDGNILAVIADAIMSQTGFDDLGN